MERLLENGSAFYVKLRSVRFHVVLSHHSATSTHALIQSFDIIGNRPGDST